MSISKESKHLHNFQSLLRMKTLYKWLNDVKSIDKFKLPWIFYLILVYKGSLTGDLLKLCYQQIVSGLPGLDKSEYNMQ